MKIFKEKISLYWKLIKSLQTGLLLATGLAGFMSCKCPVFNFPLLLGIAATLFLTISGSTVLNMWYDRDIDAKMKRTCYRPLAAGNISSREVLVLGLILSIIGTIWAVLIDPFYGLIVFVGIFFDVFVYTIWLKRRSCWSIIFGGIAGGMPILAGRTLGIGQIDLVGITLSIAILFWIPTHIMTFSMRHFDDYLAAGIPTFPSKYGFTLTRLSIAISSILATLAMGFSAVRVGMTMGVLHFLLILSAGLILLAIFSLLKPSEKLNFSLFKFASIYMLGSMILIVLV